MVKTIFGLLSKHEFLRLSVVINRQNRMSEIICKNNTEMIQIDKSPKLIYEFDFQ